ncbi:MAG: alcohol dehydrogenase catalytic domain-containing protein [Nitrospira sp.]|nr:alcohol dehydrogenase catalytic domain-containing protein [Nitrospira sp.]
MPQTMRAFVMRKLDSVGMTEKPIPDPGPNDAIVKTTAALICTSDVHTVDGAIGERTNLTLGHELAPVASRRPPIQRHCFAAGVGSTRSAPSSVAWPSSCFLGHSRLVRQRL